MAKPGLDLTKGANTSEFAYETDEGIWQVRQDSWANYTRLKESEVRYQGINGQQQDFHREFIHSERELAQRCLGRLAAEPHIVSGVLQGTATRIQIDPDMVQDLKIWNFQAGWLAVPNGPIFDHVRIQPLTKKNKAGRKGIYDWPAIKPRLQRHVATNGAMRATSELVKWCSENVTLRPGKRSEDGPDRKTVEEAIETHGLDRIAGLAPA